jgi:predicted regulator of Ras-like GTPase activity (Roadblock/LC7/MglB family)
VDPTEAIAELRELSTQIQSVTLAGRDGTLIASSLATAPAAAIASAARVLVEGAEELRADLGRDVLSQVQAATAEGNVFVVVDERRMAVATTGADPTVGLVFYDLKTLLRQLPAEASGSVAASPGGDEETAR